ncbi:MAG: phosphoglycerate dehydrogenase [Myxococcales bacterium]|nr:phosphoglycerate dehydrogenase [Myxococcales bacterium]
MKTSYPLKKIKVVLLEGVHERAAHLLREAGFQVETHAVAYQGQDLIDVAGDAHLIGLRSKTHLREDFFKAAKHLWGVGCFCIGTNQVDLDAAAAHGVPVFNAPFQNTRSVAELVISEIVALHRRLFDRSAGMHAGQWMKSALGAHEIRGRTLGIIGYGRIGSQVSVLAEAMGMQVLYHDIVDVLPMGNAQEAKSLDDLLERSDVVTLHVPATAATSNMLGDQEIACMKHGAYLINNARGHVVDLIALKHALISGHLAGAAVDVFPREPASNDEPFESPLQGLDNVILTPHIGGSTIEAQQNIAESAATRLIRLMNNGATASAVNVPAVQLPRLHANHHRIIHFHRNVPGVLSKLHTGIAELGINIAAEYLQSNPNYSYLILDIAGSDREDELRDQLLSYDETIRLRILW